MTAFGFVSPSAGDSGDTNCVADRDRDMSTGPAISDMDFVWRAEMNNLLQVSLGELAENQAVNPEVQEFSKTVVEDRVTGSNQIMALAQRNNIQIPGDLDNKDTQISALLNMKGSDFDRSYLDNVVRSYASDLRLFQRMSESSNPDFSNYAIQRLPILREHLQTAQDILHNVQAQG